jgi:hypothetical protein
MVTAAQFIFEGGDVAYKVILDGTVVCGNACSQVLCLASDVWKKFIYPPFPLLTSDDFQECNKMPASLSAEGAEDPPVNDSKVLKPPIATLDFTEDDPAALLIIFDIAHLRYANVPSSIDARMLFQIAIICNKYDCLKLATHYILKWLDKCEPQGRTFGIWLFIAWVFGLEKIFEKCAIELAETMKVTQAGRLILSNGPCKGLQEPVPDRIEGKQEPTIIAIRHRADVKLKEAFELHARCISHLSSQLSKNIWIAAKMMLA